jgi:3',5'-cyclic-AMP phosphodiesterase
VILAWATDIHVDFIDRPALHRFCDDIAASGADAVLLGGDISEAPGLEDHLRAMAERLARPIYFVLGNHDFYRGSIAEVRDRMARLTREHPHLHWLPAAGVVELSADLALVGHDGWGDARLGNPATTPILLNDFLLIRDLAGLDRPALIRRLEDLGDQAAAFVSTTVPAALQRYSQVIFLTHVPPFREACWHEGAISDDNWLPWFTCKAVGDALLAAADAHPDRTVSVLCGHTHSPGQATLRPNLTVQTGAARYGSPSFTLLHPGTR